MLCVTYVFKVSKIVLWINFLFRDYLYNIVVPEVTVTKTIEKTIEYKPNKLGVFLFRDISISENTDWNRPLRAGVGVRFSPVKNNYFGVNGDILNKDILATYAFNKKRIKLNASYSINNQYLDISAKYWINKRPWKKFSNNYRSWKSTGVMKSKFLSSSNSILSLVL